MFFRLWTLAPFIWIEFRTEGGLVMAGVFLTLVVVGINWKNKYIGSETIREQFPNDGKSGRDLYNK